MPHRSPPSQRPRNRLSRLKNELPRHRIARRSGGDAPKNPLFARAGGSAVGDPLPAGRATRGVTYLVVGALMLISGRWYFGQKFNFSGEAERVLRRDVVPQLEKQLGAHVEFGAIETDWLGRVTVHDVVIGRNAALPTGALASARSVTLNLDLPGLALRRVAILDAIHAVALDEPQIYLRRDRSGFNWQKLLSKGGAGAKTAWTGHVSATDGRVYYLDTVQPTASGRPLIVDAHGVDATLDALAHAPYQFTATAKTPLFGARQLALPAIAARGALQNDFKSGLASLQFEALPLPTVGEVLFPKRDVTLREGKAGGEVQLVFEGGKLTPSGALELQNFAATFAKFREPNSTRPLQIEAGNGPIRFADTAFSTSGATFRALDGDFQVAGAASVNGDNPIFDLQVATAALPVARLRSFLPASTRQIAFSSGGAKLSAHVSGNLHQISATGALDAPNAHVADAARHMGASFANLHTVFAASTTSVAKSPLDWRFAARFEAPNGKIMAPQGQIGAKNFVGSARGARSGGIELVLNARDFAVQTPHYGSSRGAALQVLASAPQLAPQNWRGSFNVRGASTANVRFAAISANLGHTIQKSGELGLTAQFSGLDLAKPSPNNLQSEASFSLAGLQINPDVFPKNSALPLQREDFSLGAVQGRLSLAGGQLQVSRASAVSNFGVVRVDGTVPLQDPQKARLALSLPAARLSAARFAPFLSSQRVALDGDWGGRVSLLSRSSGSGDFGLAFDLTTAASHLRGLGGSGARVQLVAPHLRGRADFNANAPARSWKAAATLEAKAATLQSGTLGAFAKLPAQLSGARAVGIKLNVVAGASRQGTNGRGANPAGAALNWTGTATVQRLSAPLPLAGRSNEFITLTGASASLAPARGGLEVSRFAARYGSSRLDGTMRVVDGKPQGRILARDVNAANVQRLVAPQSWSSARVTGLADATLDFLPDQNPTAQVHLSRGKVTFPTMQGATPFPLDVVQATVALEPQGTIAVQQAVLWSEGARIQGTARLTTDQWSGEVNLSGARMDQLTQLPLAHSFREATHPDGLIGGTFKFQTDPRDLTKASIEGSAQLKLANIAGADIGAAGADIKVENSAAGAKLAVTNLKGEAENAPFVGELRADLGANTWSARLVTSDLESGRLARLRALQAARGSDSREEILGRALAVQGQLSADINLTGTLRDAQGVMAPRAKNGFARFNTENLSWRGRTFGAVNADLEVQDGVARAKTLELRSDNAAQDAPPLISVSGELPLDPNATNLDAQIHVATAPLSFFTDALGQGRDALQLSGIEAPLYERAVTYVNALPQGTTGRVAVEAKLEGSWKAPRLHVTSLTLRDGRTRVPAGGYSPPARLDAAFTYEKNAVTVEKAEFRVEQTNEPQVGAVTGAAVAASDAANDDDDTLLRVEPGGTVTADGPIALEADVFNANLSQLSTWVPALRGNTGAPLLRGDLTEFSFRIEGTTMNPSIIGSVQGENLVFSDYTLDRLRVSRFEIANGAARIEPGNLTVVKGNFQSSAAYGKVPWKWTPPGPVRDAPIDVHFPIATRDFGALVGVFLPAISVADADQFEGSVDITGTLQTPQLAGAITIRGGQFRLDPLHNTLEAGISDLSGTVRFVGGNQLVIDADDPLKGKLVSGNSIVGRIARREEVPQPTPVRQTVAAGGPDPKKPTKGKTENKTGKNNPKDNPKDGKATSNPNAPQLAGDWVLRGSILRPVQVADLLDTGAGADTPNGRRRRRANPTPTLATALAQLRYDLNLSLDKGAFSSNAFSGVEDVSLGLICKTGVGDSPENAQSLRWMLAARGQKTKRLKSGGSLASFGSLSLRRDFATGFDALGRSVANDFTGEADFSTLPVFKRIDFQKFPDRRAGVLLDGFAGGLTGAGAGTLDGRLVLDNRPTQQRAPREAVQLQRAALTGRTASRRSLLGPAFESNWRLESDATGAANEESQGDALPDANTQSVQTNPAPAAPDDTPNETPLRLGGILTLDKAEFYGAPAAGADNATLLLSRLPAVPIFDVRLKMGRDVQIVTTAFRAGLSGEIVASGSPNNPQVLGTVQTLDGQVRFPNARARVEEGRVSIAITRNADSDSLRTRVELDATARGQAGRYAITLHLQGPLDLGSASTQDLKIDVTSNPPLSQSEAFEQLLGTVPNSENSTTNQAYASSVLSVLSAPLFSGVEQTLAQTLGLSSVGLEYRFNEPLAVQLTKSLGDRVIVTYRRSIGGAESLSSTSDRGTPFELRIDYRIKGEYLLGLQTDEQHITKLTLQKTKRF